MSIKSITALSVLSWLFATGVGIHAEDWPTFMHDNQRTSVTSESLQPPLHLDWIFESPFPPAKGWAPPVNGYGARKNKPNVSYDDAFRVIAVDDTCFFCSSAEHRIYAVNAADATVKWTFFTDAPPRLAPAYWRDKVYVGADDGIFRCLNADDGKLVWQVRAAPRNDLVLGQGRFSSAWPIRAAGIIEDGTAYFTAGLFPHQHLYFYAVDAEDGSIRWCRQLDNGGRLDHVPQGHVLSTKDSLWTTSRTAPARWSKSDGRRIDFHTPFPQVAKSHEYRFYNGGSYAQIHNGRNIIYGQACILAYDADGERSDQWGRTQKGKLLFNWFNARQIVFHDEMAYLTTDDQVIAVKQDKLAELSNNECREFEETYKRFRVANYLDLLDQYDTLVRRHGEDHSAVVALQKGPLRWGAESWSQWQKAKPSLFKKLKRQCVWMTPLKVTEALLLADNVIYAGGEDFLVALDVSDGKPLWRFETGCRVRGLAVANGRLYASSVDGTVRCFTQSSSLNSPARRVGPAGNASKPTQKRSASIAPMVHQVAEQVTEDDGYCLIVGADSADLAVELAGVSDLRIELLVTDATQVPAIRQELAIQQLYGGRVCVRQMPTSALPYPPYVFNLVIDQGSLAGSKPSLPVREIFRVTKPCGGMLLLGKPNDAADQPLASDIDADLKSLEVDNGTVQHVNGLLKITRGRIPLAADWTHNYGNAANTYCSEDPHVKGPFGLLWYGEPGPRQRIDRHATPPMPLVVNGVMFTIGYDRVIAYDIYNGIRYWEREIRGATRQGLPINTSNLAADDHSVFVAVDNGKCLRLRARNGETMSVYPAPSDKRDEQAPWAWIATDEKLLFGSQAEFDPSRRRVSEQTSSVVFALDKATGAPVWTYAGQGIDHDGIAIAAGKVFLIDRQLTDAQRQSALKSAVTDPTVIDRQPTDRRGKPIPRDLRRLVTLEASSGTTLWQRPLDVTDITLDDMAVKGKGGVACMVKDGVVVVHGIGSLGHPHKEFLAGEFARRALYAFDSNTGELLWGGRKGYRKRPIIVGDFIYAEPFAWHLRTGVQKTIRNPLSGKLQPLDFHRGYIGCGHLLASATTLFGAKSGIGYWNLDERSGFVPFGGVDLACGLGAVPAGGLFVAPEGRSGCTCDVPIHTSLALYPKPLADTWSVGFAGGRAEVASLPVQDLSINLGAPGYRQGPDGRLWIPYPARVETGLLGDWLPTYQHDLSMCYRMNDLETTIDGTDSPWIFSSGYAGEKPLKFRLLENGHPPCTYTIRLFFAEPKDLQPGQRVFTVLMQNKTVLQNFDVVEAAGAPRRAVVKEFPGIVVQGELEIRLLSKDRAIEDKPVKQPVLCGIQARRQ